MNVSPLAPTEDRGSERKSHPDMTLSAASVLGERSRRVVEVSKTRSRSEVPLLDSAHRRDSKERNISGRLGVDLYATVDLLFVSLAKGDAVRFSEPQAIELYLRRPALRAFRPLLLHSPPV